MQLHDDGLTATETQTQLVYCPSSNTSSLLPAPASASSLLGARCLYAPLPHVSSRYPTAASRCSPRLDIGTPGRNAQAASLCDAATAPSRPAPSPSSQYTRATCRAASPSSGRCLGARRRGTLCGASACAPRSRRRRHTGRFGRIWRGSVDVRSGRGRARETCSAARGVQARRVRGAAGGIWSFPSCSGSDRMRGCDCPQVAPERPP